MAHRASRQLTLLALLALAWVAPAQARTVQISARFPAKYAEAGVLQKLAITGVSGPGAIQFANLLTQDLAAVQLNGAGYFSLLQASPDRGGALAAGRAAGAEGVLTGAIAANVQQTSFRGISFGCTAANANGCVRFGLIQVPCVRRVIQVTVDVRVIRAADNHIVYTANKSKPENAQSCNGQASSKSDDSMLMDAFKGIAAEITADISPAVRSFKVKIKGGANGIPKELSGQFKMAAREAGSDLNSACGLWRQVAAEAPDSPSTLYDLGVCSEAEGDLGKASEFYQQAQRVLSPGDRDVQESLARVKSLIGAQQELARQQEAERQAEAVAAQERAAQEAAARRQEAAAERQEQQAALAERKAEAAARAREHAAQAAARAAQDAKRRAVAAKYGAGAADAIMAGRVTKGMTAEQVRAAKGEPTRREPITAGNEQWYYPGERVIFANGRVSYVGS